MNFVLQPFLEGELITLRPLKETDREASFAVAADPLIWEQHPQRDRHKRNVFDNFFNDAIKSKGALLALDTKTGQVIGSSRYYDYDLPKSLLQSATLSCPAPVGGRAITGK